MFRMLVSNSENDYLTILHAGLHFTEAVASVSREMKGEPPLSALGDTFIDVQATQSTEKVDKLPRTSDLLM